MAEDLQLPDPAPKGCEQEKWKAMVDSVIEFISASRTMLYALNERLKESEKLKEEDKKRMEDEQTKLAFYKECLHLEIQPRRTTFNAKTGEPKRLHIGEPAPTSAPKSPKEKKGQIDKSCPPDQQKSATVETECQKNADKPLMEIQACQTPEAPQETQSIQTSPSEVVKPPCPKHPDIKCKKIIAQENLHKNLAQSVNALPRCPMASRIPRTKSMVEEKSRAAMIDKAPTEGSPMEKHSCSKRTFKEITYSDLRQRSKTPKGDSPAIP